MFEVTPGATLNACAYTIASAAVAVYSPIGMWCWARHGNWSYPIDAALAAGKTSYHEEQIKECAVYDRNMRRHFILTSPCYKGRKATSSE